MDHEDSSDSFLGGLGGIQTMGIMNALKTGDPKLDMILAMCIPFVIRFLFDIVTNLESYLRWENLKKWLAYRRCMHERFIQYTQTQNTWGETFNRDNDSQNTVLLKAIQLYLHSKVKLNLVTADMVLTSTEDKSANFGGDWDCYDDVSVDNNSDNRTIAGILSAYKVVKNPIRNQWHKLGVFGKGNDAAQVELYISDNTHQQSTGENGKVRNEITRLLHFRSSKGEAIDKFIDVAYKWYMDELRKQEDNSRYLYELKANPTVSNNDDASSSANCVYKRYRLSDEKTFDSLFFRQKESLLNIVNHFQNKTGKYAIKGYPHKLGLLLHGPPGSGKTSLIKSLAHYTGRSIVNVPLARVKTNAELMSIFFDHKYKIDGECVPVKLNFKDVIFVMEDVDAASKVVQRRDGKMTAKVTQTEYAQVPVPKSLWQLILESNNDDCKALVQLLENKSDRLKAEASKPEVLHAIAKRASVLPGLGLVGETSLGSNLALKEIGDEAIDLADKLMSQYTTLDSFLRVHAQAIKSRLDSGAVVDDLFVNQLLGQTEDGSIPMLPPIPSTHNMSREVSYTMYDTDTNRVYVEDQGDNNNNNKMLSTATASSLSQPNTAGELSTSSRYENRNVRFDVSPTTTLAETSGNGGMSNTTALQSLLIKPGVDQLNLTGVLNVLDGVVDSPGRIIIMTTNHPELLDPALIRPGRIDKKLFLGYMEIEDMMSMWEHYYQTTFTLNQRNRLLTAITGCTSTITAATMNTTASSRSCQLKLTPAQVEQLAIEYDELDDLIQELEYRSRSTVLSTNVLGGHMELTYGS